MLYLSLSTAIIAVLAAIASLESGSLSNDALLFKNQAVLLQAQASDQWAYYQAKGIKGVLYSLNGNKSEGERYKKEQEGIQEKARELEERVKQANEQASERLENHHLFALSVTLFQVAIALSAIAAIMRRKPLWWIGLGLGVFGLVYFIRGFLLMR